MKVKVKLLSCVQLFAIPWAVAHQAPPSMGFSRQEYWSGLSFPPPEDLPDPGIEPGSFTLQADTSLPEPPGKGVHVQHNKYNEHCCMLHETLVIRINPGILITREKCHFFNFVSILDDGCSLNLLY